MRFKLDVADATTGKESVMELDCADETEAMTKAKAAGYFISEIKPVSSTLPPTSLPFKTVRPKFWRHVTAKQVVTAIIFLIPIGVFVFIWANPVDDSSTKAADAQKTEAQSQAIGYARARLTWGDGADFFNGSVDDRGDGFYHVTGGIHATNGFGTRKDLFYTCDLHTANGTWSCDSVNVTGL